MSIDVETRHDPLHFRQRLRVPINLKNLVSKLKKAVHVSSSPSYKWMPLSSCNNPMCEGEGNCSCPSTAPQVPHGFVAVYAGREKKRFVIPATYLNHPVFRLLLEKSEEEFGYNHKGPLIIPFELASFERLLSLIGNGDPFPRKDMKVRDLEQYYSDKYHVKLEIIEDMED